MFRLLLEPQYYGSNIVDRDAALRCVLRDGGVLLTTYGMVLHNAVLLRGAGALDRLQTRDDSGGHVSGHVSDQGEDPDRPSRSWDWVICDEVCATRRPRGDSSFARIVLGKVVFRVTYKV